jgi:DNA-binding transcriptional LysR family regulator
VDWNDLRYLLALRRAGSLAAAGRALGVDQSTVSRRLGALEEALGTQLFSRTAEGLVFTAAGESAATTAAEMERLCAGLIDSVGGDAQRLAGVVRISTTDDFADLLLRGLQGLRGAHPGILLEVVAENAPADLARGEADIAVRMFRETRSSLISRRLGQFGWALYGSAAYVARKGTPAAAAALSGHELIGYTGAAASSPGARWLEAHAGSATIVVRGSSTRSVALAIADGQGISVLPCFLAAGNPALHRLAPEVVAINEVYAVTAPDRRKLARVGVVMNELVALFERDQGRLGGAV